MVRNLKTHSIILESAEGSFVRRRLEAEVGLFQKLVDERLDETRQNHLRVLDFRPLENVRQIEFIHLMKETS